MRGYTIQEYAVTISLNASDLHFLQSALQYKIQFTNCGKGMDKAIAEALLSRLEALKGKVEAEVRTAFAFSESQVRVLKWAVIEFYRLQDVWFGALVKVRRSN